MQQKHKEQIIISSVIIFFIVVLLLYNALDSPLSGLAYVNDDFSFGFNPPVGWMKKEDNIQYALFSPTVNNDTLQTLNISARLLPTNETTYDIYQSTLVSFFYQVTVSNTSVYSSRERTVNGREAYEIILITEHDTVTLKKLYVFTGTNATSVLFIYTAPLEMYGASLSAVEQSLASFVIIQ